MEFLLLILVIHYFSTALILIIVHLFTQQTICYLSPSLLSQNNRSQCTDHKKSFCSVYLQCAISFFSFCRYIQRRRSVSKSPQWCHRGRGLTFSLLQPCSWKSGALQLVQEHEHEPRPESQRPGVEY